MDIDYSDMMGLSETWLHEYVDNNLISNTEYHQLRCDRKGKRGGGLCLYVKESIKYDSKNGGAI